MSDKMTNNEPKEKSKPFSKKIGWVIGIFTLLAAIGAGAWWWHELQVSISTDNAQVTGNIVYISPKISGCLKKLYVSEGDTIVAGQILAELDHEALALELKHAEATLELAKSNYAKLPYDIKSAQLAVEKTHQVLRATEAEKNKDQTILTDAKRDLERKNTLYRSGMIAKEELDKAQSALSQAQATLEADGRNIQAAQTTEADARTQFKSLNNTNTSSYLAQLKQAQTAYDSAKLSYDNCFIYAPTSGTVIQLPAVAGENLAANQEILALANLQATWVIANIKEDKFGRLRLNQRADVSVDAYSGRVFRGKIIALGKATQATFALIPTQNDTGNYTKVTQLLPVKIELDPSELKQRGFQLMPGMSVEVKIYTAENNLLGLNKRKE